MSAARKLSEPSVAGSFGQQFARWFDGLPREEHERYDRLAEAGRQYKGDVEAELRALHEGTHPTQRG